MALNMAPFIINDRLYIKDPMSSELGRGIISNSILLIHDIGFEDFTFKKLGKAMESTEASIYRYFENKFTLLTYLSDWYWQYLNQSICMLVNVGNHNEKPALKTALRILLCMEPPIDVPSYIHLGELREVIIYHGNKVHHLNHVDQLNSYGYYHNLKTLVITISQIIMSVSPACPYPKIASNTILEWCHNVEYYSLHLPKLSDIQLIKNSAISPKDLTYKTICDLTFALIKVDQ